MKKAVLKLELFDDKSKQKAMKTVSGLAGVDSIAMDMKDKKLTVTGDIDPVIVVAKLRKICHTEIVSVGPAKEPEKKKDEPKKDEPKKDEPKKADEKKTDTKVDVAQLPRVYLQDYYASHPHMPAYYDQHYYHSRGMEEDPNSCVIC